eukprot:7390285-Prymnesium_polylepis.1
MQRSLELALAESMEHMSPSSRSSPLTVAPDDDAYTAYSEIEEIEEDEDELGEEVQDWDFYGIGCA